MADPIDSLLTELGFEYDPKDLDKFSKDVTRSVNVIKKLGKVLIGTTAALFGFSVAITASVDEQGKLSDEIDVSVGQIDALQFALSRAGGESNAMSGTLRQLTIKAGETSRGIGTGIEAFGILGISVREANGEIKQADNLLFEISKRFETLSKSRQLELANSLGISGSIRLLQQGEEGIHDLIAAAEKLGTTNAEDTLIAEEFQDSLVDIFQIIKDISRSITRELAPVFKEINNRFSEWWINNKQLITQGMPEFFDKAGRALKFLSIVATTFIQLKLFGLLLSGVKVLGSLHTIVTKVGKAFLVSTAAIATIITTIGLLAEDAKVFFEGGNSAFGDMIEKFPEWKTELVAVAAVFATLADLTLMISDGWDKIIDLFSSDTSISDHMKALGLVGSDISGFAGGLLDQGLNFAGELLGGNTTNNSNTSSIEKIEINVSGSSDPVSVAKEVFNVFQQASQDVNSGVYQ